MDSFLDKIWKNRIKDENIKSKKDLLVYSYRVAGSVGLMMSKILKKFKSISVVDDVLVNVNIGEDFIYRRRGLKKIFTILKAF